MAARNPTTYTLFDSKEIYAGEDVRNTVPNIIEDNQHFILDQEELVISDLFPYFANNTTSYVEVATYPIASKHMCGDIGVTTVNHKFTFLAYVLTGGATGRITVTVDAGSYNFDYTNTSPEWSAFQTIPLLAGGNEEVEITFKRQAGANQVFIGGIGVYAVET